MQRWLFAIALFACEPSSGGTRMPGGGSAPGAEETGSALDGKDLFTLTNLHPDFERRVLYSLNYQLPGLLPICTQVHVQSLDETRMVFVAGGIEYTYMFRQEYLPEGVEAHLAKYFGETCDAGETLSKLDRDGIAAGRAGPGMSKDGVIKAIGYPPPHATPNLDSPQWRYWENRWGTFIVHFDGEIVRQIQN
jgi:hypothetical protein